MAIFPLAPDQTVAQMWSNGARGESLTHSLPQLCTRLTHRPTASFHAQQHKSETITLICNSPQCAAASVTLNSIHENSPSTTTAS